MDPDSLKAPGLGSARLESFISVRQFQPWFVSGRYGRVPQLPAG
jgi:hypothetical protein